MLSGMGTALGEITLVLFTTLAPSGVVAFILMGLPLLRADLAADARRRINQFLSIPLVTAMVGLVASATHLGNPANALYVFLGVGRSPLSTEVFCAVVFLALAGVYWLYSFAERPRVGLQRPWMVLAMAAGAAALLLRLKTRDPALPARLLSYRSVGTQAGLLLCLRCEAQEGIGEQKRCLAAFSPTPVSDGGSYHALIGGEIG